VARPRSTGCGDTICGPPEQDTTSARHGECGDNWAYQPSHPAYRTAWPTIVADTRRIIDHVHATGIVLAGPDGLREPVCDPHEDIAFNGDATRSLHGDPCQLLAPLPRHPRGIPTAVASCATGRRPYDLGVAAVLLRCVLLVPEAFAVASDGRWEAEWAHGAHQPLSGPRTGARQLLADLFDLDPTDSPLREHLTGVHVAAPTTPQAPRPLVSRALDSFLYCEDVGIGR